ncbi:MAG TPA: hypothetical protein DHV17_03865 [Chitinophagaceae bacterium]|nr:hypothetical protein [Chitinophagaceae bacterium]
MYFCRMKFVWILVCLAIGAIACKSSKKAPEGQAIPMPVDEPVKPVFFPVTSFLEGQLTEIREKGLNPIRVMKQTDGREDSTWLKMEELPFELKEFFQPRIDSAGMSNWFSEKSFMDESLGFITLTYERKSELPDSIDLKEWTVYIDPETDKVNRIYIVRQSGDSTRQLTWQAGKQCHIVHILSPEGAKPVVQKDVYYHWDF